MGDDPLRGVKIRSAEKLERAMVAERYSASRMNDTKWAELVEALIDLHLLYRIQFVDVDAITRWTSLWAPARGYFETGQFVPFKMVSVEFLEIDPRHQFGACGQVKDCDHAATVETRLAALGIPFEVVDGGYRVIGHVRRSPRDGLALEWQR